MSQNNSNSKQKDKSSKLKIDGENYVWPKQFITGLEVKTLANLDSEAEVFIKINGSFEDEAIGDDTIIDLNRPGLEHFYSVKKKVSIFINNNEKLVKPGSYSVSQIKALDNVPTAHELEQLIGGKLTPLDDNATVVIKGSEQFFSHVRDGSSS